MKFLGEHGLEQDFEVSCFNAAVTLRGARIDLLCWVFVQTVAFGAEPSSIFVDAKVFTYHTQDIQNKRAFMLEGRMNHENVLSD